MSFVTLLKKGYEEKGTSIHFYLLCARHCTWYLNTLFFRGYVYFFF